MAKPGRKRLPAGNSCPSLCWRSFVVPPNRQERAITAAPPTARSAAIPPPEFSVIEWRAAESMVVTVRMAGSL
jgi:hypothetical protein